MKAIELIICFECDCACVMCPGLRLVRQPEMSLREIVAWLQYGRQQGAEAAVLGGGEPTISRALLPALQAARRLGYPFIEIATNGIRLAEPAFTDRCISAGANYVSVLVLGAAASTHDRLARRSGAYDAMLRAVGNLAQRAIPIRAEVLISTASLAELSSVVTIIGALGVKVFRFWLVSLHGLPTGEARHLLPSLSEVRGPLQAAFDVARQRGLEATSLHTPPCTLDPEYRDRYRHAGLLGLMVVTPGGRPFEVESSPIEGGVFIGVCDACSARHGCLGLRSDYLHAFGGDQITPVHD